VTRYYSVPGELPDLYQQARAAVVQSGFADVQDTSPNCDLITNAARCSIAAASADVRIEVYIFGPGEDPDQVGVGVLEQPTVRITARHP
jgi:hypothetical protein